MYTTYCANQPKALAILDRLSKTPSFSDYLQESLLNPETRALTLFSFLIKPIQRICKYPLLLKVQNFFFFIFLFIVWKFNQ